MALKLLKDDFGIETIQFKDGKESTEDFLNDTDVIGFYFSAHWCPPCRGFTPVLAEKYTKWKSANERIKIIFVSSDRSDNDFNGYYNKMPWHALPFDNREAKEKMATKYEVRGIPTLIIVGKDGEIIDGNGRQTAMTNNETLPWKKTNTDAMQQKKA